MIGGYRQINRRNAKSRQLVGCNTERDYRQVGL